MVVTIQLLGGGESKGPLWEIVHRAPVPLFPGIHGFQAGPGHEAVEMERAVLVPLRHKDIAQPMAADHIVSPPPQRPRDGCAIIAVNPRRVKCQGHEVVEVVGKRQAAELRPRPAHTALHVDPLRFLARFAGCRSGLRLRLRPACRLPSRFPEDGRGAAQNVLTAVRIAVDQSIMGNIAAILHGQPHSSDGIMS